MGPTWGPSGADRTQTGPMLAQSTLLSGIWYTIYMYVSISLWEIPFGSILLSLLTVWHNGTTEESHYWNLAWSINQILNFGLAIKTTVWLSNKYHTTHYTVGISTYCGQDKWLRFCKRHFKNTFSPMKIIVDQNLNRSRINIVSISYETAIRWMPQDLADDKSTLVQVMTWCL